MKKVLLIALLFVFLLPALSIAAHVDGYMKDTDHDGYKDTYVRPHERTNPNDRRTDNYDYPGNYNPNTGKNTPSSSSPRENFPSNPNPYEQKQHRGW